MKRKSDFKSYLTEQGKAQSTVIHYNRYVLDFLAWLDREAPSSEDVASASDVLGYLDHLQKKGLENKTRNIRLNVIRHYFSWQLSSGVRTDNPIAHLKIRGIARRKLHKVLGVEEMEKIITLYKVPGEDDPRSNRNWFRNYRLSRQRNKVILAMMIYQGLTTKEVERMHLDDLLLKQGKIFIAGSRTSEERTLELKSAQIVDLMEYQFSVRVELAKNLSDRSKRLFLPVPTAGQKKIKSDTFHIWKRLSEELKELYPGFVNFRQIRASVITHWIGRHNLRQVQYMAGHRYVSSTESYIVHQTDELRSDIDEFHPL